MSEDYSHYYVPEQSYWPIVGALGLFFLASGIAGFLHESSTGLPLLAAGVFIILAMIFGWFRDVIRESHQGLYSAQMDRSFRWGMGWFIFSEVMFFAAFFGVLFYARTLIIPWLGGEGHKIMTHTVLWPDFQAAWPLLVNPDPEQFPGPQGVMDTWGLPALNTAILLTSGVTITWAHWALKKAKRGQLALGLFLTVALGAIFLYFQAEEYIHAYQHLDLRLDSGIYGSTFFMLTGFHGMHVTLGSLMLFVIFLRCLKGHFTAENHFAFEAVAWYWHFVDFVWLFLFIFVYWL